MKEGKQNRKSVVAVSVGRSCAGRSRALLFRALIPAVLLLAASAECQTVSQSGAVDAGSANVCPSGQSTPAPCSQSVTLNYDVTGSGTLGAIQAVTQGAPNLDFTVASGSTCTGDVTAGSTCTVNVTFAPRAPGLRLGAVQLTDATGNVLATTLVHGVGQGPAIAFGSGVQSTLASGLFDPEGIVVDAADNVYIADFNPGVGTVVKVPAGGGAPVRLSTGVLVPGGVAVDGAGNLYVSDEDLNHVVKIPADGSAKSTLGSNLSAPESVAVDAAGNVFIVDSGNGQVVEVPAGGGAQVTVSSGLNYPGGIAVDAAGNLFIADYGHNRVVEVPAGGGPQTTVSSGPVARYGVGVDATGDVFVGHWDDGQVFQIQRSQPPTFSFAATSVNSTSSDSPQSVTIQNIGNSPLQAIAPGLAIGANFAQAAGSGTPADCTSTFTLAPGASCNLSISFTPTVSGSLQGSAVLTDNALDGNPATQTITLLGTGIALAQTITFNPIPNQVQGTAVGLTASASSGLPVSFTSLTPAICAVSGNTATLLAPGTCTIQASQAGNAAYSAATPVSQSFTVLPAANFTITPIPPAETVYRGVVGGFILQLKSVNGFNGYVKLSCSGGPAGSYCLDFRKAFG